MDVEPGEGQQELHSGWCENGKEEVETQTDRVVIVVDFADLTGSMIEHRIVFEDAYWVVDELGSPEEDASALDLAGTGAPVDAVQEVASLLPGETDVADREEVVATSAGESEYEAALQDELVAVGCLKLQLGLVHLSGPVPEVEVESEPEHEAAFGAGAAAVVEPALGPAVADVAVEQLE